MAIPEHYIGREQALVKHTILKDYILRLFMIIGQSGEATINFVDCFAGPWCEGDADLKDTSIGISINEINKAINTLKKNNKSIKFRALYIEKDEEAFKKLNAFISKSSHLQLDASCIQGDYTQKIDDIVSWAGDYFTFFFIDPKGWKDVVSPEVLRPLLQIKKSEFLINLMYDFANRAASMSKHAEDIESLVGEKIPLTGEETSDVRQNIFLSTYCKNIKSIYQTDKANKVRASYLPIYRPGSEKVLYFLVYFTSHPTGIKTFKETSEKMLYVQRVTQQEVRLKKQEEQRGTGDLFGCDESLELTTEKNNKYQAKNYLEDKLSGAENILIDIDCWADFLEESGLYPTDFQLAIKELYQQGSVINIDADVSRRRTQFIQPKWKSKSERWKKIK